MEKVSSQTVFFTKKFKKKILDIIVIGVSGSLVYSVAAICNNDENFYKSIVMPIFHNMEPERAHRWSILGAKHGFFRKQTLASSMLETKASNLIFKCPIGLAAGYDKQGDAVKNLFKMGFGFVEVGSVTSKPQPGNPLPRVFRLKEDMAIINRYGFNSDGHEAVYQKLKKLSFANERPGLLGVNLGKNKESSDPIKDYVLGVEKFGAIADYLVINISSPNTPGLRDMQQKKALEKLTSSIIESRNKLPSNHRPALFLKISPDLSCEHLKDIADVISKEKCQMDGLIISNTTVTRPENTRNEMMSQIGGLSGQPLKDLSTNAIKSMAILTQGKIPIIGVGGISSGKDALEKIENGASVVQIYSSFAFEGPPIVKRIYNELEQLLRENGYQSIQDAVGAKLKK